MVNQIEYSLAESPVIEEDSQKIVKIRHTCAHVLAMAVQTLFPETKVAIGDYSWLRGKSHNFIITQLQIIINWLKANRDHSQSRSRGYFEVKSWSLAVYSFE